MSNKTTMFGFEIINPPEISGPGEFAIAPPIIRVTTVTKHVSTQAHIDHDVNWAKHVGPWDGYYDKVCTMSLDFHWKPLKEVKTENQALEIEHKWTHGNANTDTQTTSMTQTLGAEGGGEAKGLSLKLSESLSTTNSTEHSVTITDEDEELFNTTCPPNTTMQLWQLIATFTYEERIPPFDVGYSVDWYNPTYRPGVKIFTVPTSRILYNTFPAA